MDNLLNLLKKSKARIMLYADGTDIVIKIRKDGNEFKYVCRHSEVEDLITSVLSDLG